jgi:hypothetical protein
LLSEISCEGNVRNSCVSKPNSSKNTLQQLNCSSSNEGSTPACDAGECVGVTSVSLGDQHSCIILDSKSVQCWGDNKYGQVGVSGDLPKIPRPTLISGLAGVTQLALGSRHSCALTASGAVWCWGDNSRGQLGIGSGGSQSSPVQLEDIPEVEAIAAGGMTTCALTSDKKLFCWGDGEFGQTFVSPGASKTIIKPTEVVGAPAFSKVALGHRHGCGLGLDGSVHCWGDPSLTGGASPSNTKISLSGTYLELDVGALHSCARGPGGFFCWGDPGPKLGSAFAQGIFTNVGLLSKELPAYQIFQPFLGGSPVRW